MCWVLQAFLLSLCQKCVVSEKECECATSARVSLILPLGQLLRVYILCFSGLCPLHSPLRLQSHPTHSRTLPSWTDAAYTGRAPSTHRAACAGKQPHTHAQPPLFVSRQLFCRIKTPHIGLDKASLIPGFLTWLHVWCDLRSTSWCFNILIDTSVVFI